MNILIVGASAGLGRALSDEGGKGGHNLFLFASDARDLGALASDIKWRHGVEVEYLAGDICARADRGRLVLRLGTWRSLDSILLPIGVARDDDNGALDDATARRIIDSNFYAQSSLITALWEGLRERQGACVVGFGSIAAGRGRRRNIMYAAAKRALESYFESLRALGADTGTGVQLYALGYMRTQQTFGRDLLLPVASPDQVAGVVFRDLHQFSGHRYHPAWWGLVVSILRRLPWFIYRRLNF